MDKVQFFSAPDIDPLQDKVNLWLGQNKSIEVKRSGLSTFCKVDGTEKYTFYILYTIIDGQMSAVEELIENSGIMTSANDPVSIQQTEIQPNVLNQAATSKDKREESLNYMDNDILD